jgi:enoyl-CoA hydratase/carnithine racemase
MPAWPISTITRASGFTVSLVRLPTALNLQDFEFFYDMQATLEAIADQPPRPILFAGQQSSQTFCAGLDLNLLHTLEPASFEDFIGVFNEGFRSLMMLNVPTAVAFTGHAIAGGAIFGLACDHRVGVESVADNKPAKVGLNELAFGIPFPTAAASIVRCALGETGGAWKPLLTSGRIVTMVEAHKANMVHETADSQDDAIEVALARLEQAHPNEAAVRAYGPLKKSLRMRYLPISDEAAEEEDRDFISFWSSDFSVQMRKDYFATKGIAL